MGISRTKPDIKIEQLLLHAVLTNDVYLKMMQPHRDHVLFANTTLEFIYNTAYKYYDNYGTAISGHILDELETDDTESIMLLDNIDFEEEYEGSYCVDKHVAYINKQKASDIAARLKGSNDRATVLDEWDKLEVVDNDDVNLRDMTSDERWATLQVEEKESIVTFSGGLGRMLNYQLVPHCCVALQAPEKGCKSWLLGESAIRAAMFGKNAVIISAGDMNKEEYNSRNHIRIAGRNSDPKHCKARTIAVPDCKLWQKNDFKNVLCDGRDERARLTEKLKSEGALDLDILDKDGNLLEDYEAEITRVYHPCKHIKGCRRCRPSYWYEEAPEYAVLDSPTVDKAMERFWKFSGGGNLRVKAFRMDSATMLDIENYLDSLEEDIDWVVIDYMDIVAPHTKGDERKQTNDKWKALRRLSQREDRNWGIITASQADAESYDLVRQTRKNFSGDKRKYAHVTAMYAINQTERERTDGVLRLSPLVVRSDKFNSSRDALVCTDLARGRVNNYSI